MDPGGVLPGLRVRGKAGKLKLAQSGWSVGTAQPQDCAVKMCRRLLDQINCFIDWANAF